MSSAKPQTLILVLLTLAIGILCRPSHAQTKPSTPIDLGARMPMIAMWRTPGGKSWKSKPIALRFAVWDDGRFLFASDGSASDSRLKEGRISAEQVSELQKTVISAGAFQLMQPSYVIPDVEYETMEISMGKRKQMLDCTPFFLAERAHSRNKDQAATNLLVCWEAIKAKISALRPPQTTTVSGTFGAIPQSWYVTVIR